MGNEGQGNDYYGRFASDLLAGKVALVTGGGTGMGRATAIEMSRCGAQIALLGRRREVLDDCAGAITAQGGDALAIQGDTREPEQIQAAMDQIRARYGRLDILVNNAGGQFVAGAKDISHKGFEAVIRNNLFGTWCMTKVAAENFFFDHGGKVVSVTLAHRSGLAGYAHSVAARGGIVALMKTLAVEWARYGILLNCVAPGTIQTEAWGQYPIPEEEWDKHKQARNLLKRYGRPEEVAGAIIFLASPLGDFITGEEWYVDGGETRNLAHDMRDLINPEMFKKRVKARDLK